MERNWAGNHAYGARILHRPAGVDEVRELAAACERIRVLGTRHSFTAIADSEELMLSCYLSQDFQEGVRAFLEKRPANWQSK